MNRLQRYFLPLALGAFLFSACEAPNDNVGSGDPSFGAKPGGGGTTPAQPAIAYVGTTTVSKQTRNTIAVKDSDGTHMTNLIVAGDALTNYRRPVWSPDGSKLVYVETASGTNKIKITSVSVVNGVATAGTTTTLVSLTPAVDSLVIYGCDWSQGSNDEIVYSVKSTKTSYDLIDRPNKIYVIPASGGAATEIYSKPGTQINFMSYSPDGSKVVFNERTFKNNTPPLVIADTLKVIDVSTQAVTSYVSGDNSDAIEDMEWSRTGQNMIAYVRAVASGTGTQHSIHLLDVDQNSSTLLVSGARYPTWSPTNYKIAYNTTSTGTACSTIVVSTGVKALLNTGGTRQHWKK